MSCSIGTLIGSECGTTSSKLNITQEKIPISLCQKDVSNHFHTTSVTDISTEYDLILTRAVVFEYDKEYISRTTVYPKHRYQLGGGWFQKRVCCYPDHTGKAKPDRSINKLQSKIMSWVEKFSAGGLEMPSLHVFPLDNWVLSTGHGLIMWIGHRKEIRKLTFRELALRRSESAPNYLVILPADAAHSFFRSLRLLFMFFKFNFPILS